MRNLEKVILLEPNIIKTESERIKHHNAFILSDGTFYLAKGYTGCNPSQQLESSALTIAKREFPYDMMAEYDNYFKGLMADDVAKEKTIKRFYYLRSVLVHYYGYVLFARIEFIKNYNDRNKFFDESLVPNPQYYGEEPTKKQIEILESLFELNDDGTLLFDSHTETSNDVLQRVIMGRNDIRGWHR